MIDDKRVIAIIPARGGSKGIKLKNIYPLYNAPLISYSIRAAQQSHYIDTIMVSTDHEEIASYARSCGVETPFQRPQELATDIATTISVVHHALHYYYEQGLKYDIVITLQPTQPLIQGWHIDEALEEFQRGKESIVGITQQDVKPLLLRTLKEDNELAPILAGRSSTVRRQDMEAVYIVNGMIYINKAEDIYCNPELSLNDNRYGYIIDPMYYIDIDTMEDIELCTHRILELNQSHLLHNVL